MLGSKTDIFEPLREIRPDIIALGANQFFKEKDLEAQLRVHGIDAKVVRINSFRQCELCSSAAIMRKVIERQ
jgi:FAD synthetase